MCLSYDTKYLLTGSDDGTVRCWDIWDGLQVGIFCAHSNQVFNIKEIIMDNETGLKYLISCSADGKCCIWPTSINAKYCIYPSIDQVKKLENNIPKIFNLPQFIFTHDKQIRDFEDIDRKLIFTVSDDTKLKIWSLITGKCIYIDNSEKCVLNNVIFIRPLNKIFVGGSNGLIYSWNLNINIDHKIKDKISTISRIELRSST